MKFSKVTSTHPFYDPQLLSKTVASDRLNRNWIYGMPMTSIQEMREDQVVLTIDMPYSNPKQCIIEL